MDRIPTMIGGELSQDIRHECYLVGFCFKYQVHKFLLFTIAFDIKFSCNDLFYFPYIAVPDMSLIGTGMHRDAICSKCLDIDCRLYYIRIITAS